jgi:hypothetical protein
METTARGYVTASGIECGDDCVENYLAGKKVWLKAHPMPHSYFKQWAGDCSGTRSAISVIMDSDKSCIAIFGSDSDIGAVKMVEEFKDNAEMSTGEKVNDLYPGIYNRERYEQAFRFAEKAMMTAEEQLLLPEHAWPEHFDVLDNWFNPMPDNLYVERVQIKSGTEMIGNYDVEGQYVRVDVWLINKEGKEELVPILVYYKDKPKLDKTGTATETTKPMRRRGTRWGRWWCCPRPVYFPRRWW